jgi:AcrR family transcriptional regulator
MTRQALLDAAARLFEAHGYDNVTVAQIADAANISVKTMFTYFASKEDLAFADEGGLRDQLVYAITNRAANQSTADSAVAMMSELIAESAAEQSPVDALEGFRRGYGDSAALQNRLRRMWQDYEDALVEAIAASTPGLSRLDARLEAMHVAMMVRFLTTPEVQDTVEQAKNPLAALQHALKRAAGHRGARAST